MKYSCGSVLVPTVSVTASSFFDSVRLIVQSFCRNSILAEYLQVE